MPYGDAGHFQPVLFGCEVRFAFQRILRRNHQPQLTAGKSLQYLFGYGQVSPVDRIERSAVEDVSAVPVSIMSVSLT